MFTPSASHTDRLATARAIDEGFLPAMVQSLARAGDVTSLQLFKGIGRFEFGSKEVYGSERRPYAILSEACIPHIDALVALLDNRNTDVFNVSTPLVGRSHHSGTFQRIKVSDEMRDFVRETCRQAFGQFDELRDEVQRSMASRGVKADNTMARMLDERRLKTSSVVSAIAAAINDVDLFTEVHEADANATALELLDLSKFFPGHNVKAQGIALAVLFENLDVLQAVSEPAVLSSPFGQRFDPSDGIAGGEDLTVGEILEMRPGAPSPAMLKVILEKIAYEAPDGKISYAEGDEAWLRDSLIPAICGGDWSHLLQTVFDHAPQILELDAPVVQAHAAIFSLPVLLHRTIGTMAIEPLEEQATWFASEHPISRMVGSAMDAGKDRGNLDESLLLVIDEMVQRGQESDLFSARLPYPSGGTFAHFCASEACDATLVRLAEMGLDMDVRDKLDTRIEARAEVQGHEQTAHLVRSLRSRQSALLAIEGIDLDSKNTHRRLVDVGL